MTVKWNVYGYVDEVMYMYVYVKYTVYRKHVTRGSNNV